jgi:uncharacterized phage protein (TIGR01671 family)
MREIEFRGKRVDTGEWARGYLYCIPFGYDNPRYGYNFICEFAPENLLPGCNDFMLVRPETVGQYTGLTDKNGVKIFEGDILLWRHTESSGLPARQKTVVFFEEGSFSIKRIDNFYPSGLAPRSGSLYEECGWFDEAIREYPQGNFFYEVTGNIHDNPELLKAAMPAEGADKTAKEAL